MSFRIPHPYPSPYQRGREYDRKIDLVAGNNPQPGLFSVFFPLPPPQADGRGIEGVGKVQ
jgi:hypothetical protein